VYVDFNTSNILTSRTRTKNSHFTYLSYFSTVIVIARTPVHFRPYRDALLPALKTWKQMLSYIYSTKFKAAADVKIKALLVKRTFKYTSIPETDDTVPLLVMWVFTYKFDKEGTTSSAWRPTNARRRDVHGGTRCLDIPRYNGSNSRV
jgi:hypothetical protein